MYNPEFNGDVCSHKHAFFLDNFIRRLFQNPKKILEPYIRPGDTVLDLGCGPGYFTIDMAEMVGDVGRVFAVDLQKEMLARVARKAALKNLTHIIHLHQCTQAKIGLGKELKADFILAYYMVHETRDLTSFLSQVNRLLLPTGKFLIVEPPFHVSGTVFDHITRTALDNGFTLEGRPKRKGERVSC